MSNSHQNFVKTISSLCSSVNRQAKMHMKRFINQKSSHPIYNHEGAELQRIHLTEEVSLILLNFLYLEGII